MTDDTFTRCFQRHYLPPGRNDPMTYIATPDSHHRLVHLDAPEAGIYHVELTMPEARDLLNTLQASIDAIDRRDA